MNRKTLLLVAAMMLGSGAIGGLVATWAGSARVLNAQPSEIELDSLRVRRISLVEQSGLTRGTLSANPDGFVSLALNDRDGYQKAFFGVSPFGTSTIGLQDGRGHVRINLSVEPNGKFGIYLGDFATGLADLRGQIAVGGDGNPLITLHDQRGNIIFQAPAAPPIP